MDFFRSKSVDNGRHILVVEDNAIDRKIVVAALEKQGYSVETACNGVEGLKSIENNLPEAVILDWEMPGMGGLQMCRALKENKKTVNIPVIFLTGLDAPTNILDSFEADAENFFTKPLKPKLLIKELERIFAELKNNKKE
ncbi:MAG: CheY-like chemotaxis protein [Lysobacterales bacterium]|jgi:CheY-like chemotaxis protein